MKNILVTGGCGFIGSHFINRFLKNYDCNIVNIDCLNYCSSIKNIEHPNSDKYSFVCGNITDMNLILKILENYSIDTIVHFAAQTHVDNSFENSLNYTNDNILGTHILLESSRVYGKIKKFFHMSTDEVYGDIGENKKKEDDTLLPTNPYAATKAGAELIVKSYYHSYGIPVIITRSNNVYGPKQYYEKLIPKFINSLLNNLNCTIHGNGENKRAFVYVEDTIDAIEIILNKGKIGEIYNIGSSDEYTVLEILDILHKKICPQKDINEVKSYVSDRPYNDKRYYVCDEKLKKLGWMQNTKFNDGIYKTIDWYNINLKNNWLN